MLDISKLRLSQPSLAGSWAELGNIRNRISKGVGIISQIMNMLETVTLGEHFFTTAVLLRESKFLNGILTNSEI